MTSEKIDVKAQIIKLVTSETYLKLQEYYASNSLFNIIKKERSETVHSNVLYWLFNPESNHGLSFYPIKAFLLLLCRAKDETYNSECVFNPNFERSFILGNYEIYSAEVIREKNTGKAVTKGKKEKYGLVDLVMEIDISINNERRILPIIIENKVGGKENDYTVTGNGMQTEFYHEWGKEYYNGGKFFDPLYVFLQVKLKETKCAVDKAYINIFYQELEDMVLIPCLNQKITPEGKYTLREYIRCLSYSSVKDVDGNAKGVYIMGFSADERTYLKEFYETNKELIHAMANCLKDDDDYDAEERKTFRNMSETIRNNTQKYIFDGKEYGKGPLVLAVVGKYISDNPSIKIDELQNIFPKVISYETVKLKKDLTEKEDGTVGNHHFFDKKEILLESGEPVVVCREWSIKNIGKFIDCVEKNILPNHPDYLIKLK